MAWCQECGNGDETHTITKNKIGEFCDECNPCLMCSESKSDKYNRMEKLLLDSRGSNDSNLVVRLRAIAKEEEK